MLKRTLEQLAYEIEQDDVRSRYGSLVLAHGCFDILTLGHVRHLQAARRMGFLVVTITPDRFIAKGAGRPYFPEDLRDEMMRALECVSAVAINLWPTAVETIKLLRPAFYVKGAENRGRESPGLLAEKEAVESVGGKLVYTEELEFHSTDILEKLKCLS